VPERLCDALLEPNGRVINDDDYFYLTHMTEIEMTDQEIHELPKVWIVGGDGALGDIGFQNLSKVILQNRPNVMGLMLDTQVYSNTGGQNSDSSTMLGGYDMNQFGSASQGKLTEKKNVAEAFTSGHGSPFVAQVSMANSVKLYKAMLDGLEYRGSAFFQCYTTCQPEHGVADDMSAHQAKAVRDSRGMPEFVFNPRGGETAQECFNLKGNPTPARDWWLSKYKSNGEKYNYTVAHWAVTEARFRNHLKKVKAEDVGDLMHFDNMLACINQEDTTYRRVFDEKHRSYVPDFKVYIVVEIDGKLTHFTVSRQLVLFAVERRKAWRMLQSKAGIENKDYLAQRNLLKKVDSGDIQIGELRSKTAELLAQETDALG
jgi:pyruvate-ferredoxin/flavodoxin oxidoreductase